MSASTLAAKPQTKNAELREKIHSSVGQIVIVTMNLARCKNQNLSDLNPMTLESLRRERLSIATVQTCDGNDGGRTLAGMAIWATVSKTVDIKIQEQIRGGAFTIRLNRKDRVSEEKLWLPDVVVLICKLATAVLAGFSHIAKGRPVNIHSIVARAAELSLLRGLRTSRGAQS